jgi:Na+-transporting methylmalonyl-CoA/oxaloacetate decarboxylase beta subunit
MFILLGIICVFILLLSVISNRSGVSSVGIIGAADGPTSILISGVSTIDILLFVGMVAAILTCIVVCIIVIKKK